MLDELGQQIITVRSGDEALKYLLEHEFAVILLDVNMPGMDGLETADVHPERQRTAHTPIIFLTAYADEMHTAQGYSLGAVDYILTPVVPDILRTKVKVFVQLHRMTRQMERQADAAGRAGARAGGACRGGGIQAAVGVSRRCERCALSSLDVSRFARRALVRFVVPQLARLRGADCSTDAAERAGPHGIACRHGARIGRHSAGCSTRSTAPSSTHAGRDGRARSVR